MTDSMDPIILNFLYAAFGGFLTLFFMWLGCTLFNRITCNFNIPDELSKGNVAVGLMVMGLFIGVGTALGLVIGLALGLWFGFNMGTDRPLLSNPFEETTFQEKIKETGGTLMEKGGEVLEKGGQALKQQAEEGEPLAIPEDYTR